MHSLFQLFRSLAVMAAVSISASAHEVKEMTARARVFSDRVEMVITISTHMASVLLADPKEPSVEPTPGMVPALRTRLDAQARAFCSLLPGGKKALAPASVDVVMTTSEELSFYLTYPAVNQSPLRFEMPVLDRIEPGNVVALEVLDATRKVIGTKQLKRGESALEIPLADNAPAPAK